MLWAARIAQLLPLLLLCACAESHQRSTPPGAEEARSPRAHSAQSGSLPIPDRLVVLTFDDGTKTDITTVAPILKRWGFGASFYVTNGLKEIRGESGALSWHDIKQLNADGFEIGNHTDTHPNLNTLSRNQVLKEVEDLEADARKHGIPVPTTFVYPGFRNNMQSAAVLLEKGYLFARRGVLPEYPYGGEGGRGPAYDPAVHHPLFLPATGVAGPAWHFEDLIWAVDQAKDGKIIILNYHGVPYPGAPWVSVEPREFERDMQYLHQSGATVIAMRDLAKYVQPASETSIPLHQEPERPHEKSTTDFCLKYYEALKQQCDNRSETLLR